MDFLEVSLEGKMGITKGHKALQIVILISPVLLIVILGAMWTLMSGAGPIIDNQVKGI